MGTNSISLTGNITRNPELRDTSTGTQVLAFSLTVDKHAKQDKRVDKANWVAVFLLGQEAESMSRHLSKDSHVNVHGRLIQRTWVTKDGHQHSRLEVIADDIDLTTSSQRQEEPQTQTHNHIQL